MCMHVGSSVWALLPCSPLNCLTWDRGQLSLAMTLCSSFLSPDVILKVVDNKKKEELLP